MVIGVHAPEFAFEQDVENVRRAMKDLRVEYPIAIDNDFAIWRAFTEDVSEVLICYALRMYESPSTL